MPVSSTISRSALAEPGSPPADFFVEDIFKDAKRAGASEIRLVPGPHRTTAGRGRAAASVQFLIAGLLHEIVRYPNDAHEAIVARLKASACLQEDARLVAQEGTLRLPVGSAKVNIRVSVVPMVEGEKVMLQLPARPSARRRSAV